MNTIICHTSYTQPRNRGTVMSQEEADYPTTAEIKAGWHTMMFEMHLDLMDSQEATYLQWFDPMLTRSAATRERL
jgi:hypothetical protein